MKPDRWPRIVFGIGLVAAAAIVIGIVIVVTRNDSNGALTASENGETECAEVDAPSPREPETREAPSGPLDTGTTYSLIVTTNCGSFTIALDLDSAPNASASLVALASDGYFDDTSFHRVAPDFVIQGGDPTGTRRGGPGYQTVDAPPAGAMYVKGVVAMAKTELDPPGSAGSQFFVVTGENIGLPAEYAIVGEVTAGMDAVERIEALGEGDGPPSQPVVIETITVEES